jgi:hypothetical protein
LEAADHSAAPSADDGGDAVTEDCHGYLFVVPRDLLEAIVRKPADEPPAKPTPRTADEARERREINRRLQLNSE